MTTYQYPKGLESERLVTRKLTLDDIPVWSGFFITPETTEFLKAQVLETPEASAYKWLDRQLNRYKNHQYGHQAILDKHSGEFLGMAGLIQQEIDGVREIEVGYHVLREHWGKGYATEAAKIFFDYGFKQGISDSIISMIDVNNVRSQRVAEKNGLKRESQIRYKDLDILVYRIQKADWPSM
jgi:ribosomal-protein-alanine N-acetyltransferase